LKAVKLAVNVVAALTLFAFLIYVVFHHAAHALSALVGGQ
jgi:hypothetical protein